MPDLDLAASALERFASELRKAFAAADRPYLDTDNDE